MNFHVNSKSLVNGMKSLFHLLNRSVSNPTSLKTISDASVKKQTSLCTYCPKMCRPGCPVSTVSGREALIPQTKMSIAGKVHAQTIKATYQNTMPIWGCTGCHQCTSYCDHHVMPSRVLLSERAHIETHPALIDYPQQFTKHTNRLKQHLKDNLPYIKNTSSTVAFIPGCDIIDTPWEASNPIENIMTLFNAREIPSLLRDHAICGGYPLFAGGFLKEFDSHLKTLVSECRTYNDLVLSCSTCAVTLDQVGTTYRLPKIWHITEWLHDNTQQQSTRQRPSHQRPSVYYHDPCYLAQHKNVTQQPRALLSQIATVREFPSTDVSCCGGGGLLPKTMPKIAHAMATRRLQSIPPDSIVVTSCPSCALMLHNNAPSSMKVYDLPQFIASHKCDTL